MTLKTNWRTLPDQCSYQELRDHLAAQVPNTHTLEIVQERFEIVLWVHGVGMTAFRLRKGLTCKAIYSYLKLYEVTGGVI
jgi:hypothetical protein